MMIAKTKSRLVVLVLLASMLLQIFGSVAVYAADESADYGRVINNKIKNSTTLHSLDDMEDLMVSTSYKDYLEQYAALDIPDADGEPIRIYAKDAINEDATGEEAALLKETFPKRERRMSLLMHRQLCVIIPKR